MNRQQVGAIAQAVRYRLEHLWTAASEGPAIESVVRAAFRTGITAAKEEALFAIREFADPPPPSEDWETYG